MKNGSRAQEMLKFIKEHKSDDVSMCLAGTFDGGIYLPEAICAELFRSCDGDFSEILSRVARRSCINFD